MTRTVTISAARSNLSKLLEEAAGGGEIVITRAGKKVARLVGLAPERQPRVLGVFDGRWILPEDFDAPLPDDVLDSFERG